MIAFVALVRVRLLWILHCCESITMLEGREQSAATKSSDHDTTILLSGDSPSSFMKGVGEILLIANTSSAHSSSVVIQSLSFSMTSPREFDPIEHMNQY